MISALRREFIQSWAQWVRLCLSIGLLYGIYTETGPWTTLAFCLVLGFSELTVRLIKQNG